MRKVVYIILVISIVHSGYAQPRPGAAMPSTGAASGVPGKLPAGSRVLNIDSSITTHAEVTINGQRVPYDATAGTIPVWDEEGKPIAGLFYTYYERSDVKDRA